MATSQKQDIDLGITRFEYGEADRPQRAVLTLKTKKSYGGGVISDAIVYWVGAHSRKQMLGVFDVRGGDFSCRRMKVDRAAKATQRNINRQHAEVFTPEVIEKLTQEAKAHYAEVVKAGKDGLGNTY